MHVSGGQYGALLDHGSHSSIFDSSVSGRFSATVWHFGTLFWLNSGKFNILNTFALSDTDFGKGVQLLL